ncbi:TetR/AcrR family transcriptional regulator [Faunimonas sp. B44]|uniref:TetR/AcrR family transcriptional regulator n=1 Tax=Faunimonas sp. B44 TaxID=3461493 RepID=UPI00404411DA
MARKSAEVRKNEIVDAVLALADRGGPDRLATGTVAEAVGLTQPALFRHFPTKQAMWGAVVERIRADMELRWRAASAQPVPPLDALRGIVAAQLGLIRDVPAIPSILFSRELHAENPAMRAMFRALMARFHRRLSLLLAEAQKAGEIDRAVDPADLAFLVMTIIQGLTMRWSIADRAFDLVGEGLRLLDVQLAAFAGRRAEALP